MVWTPTDVTQLSAQWFASCLTLLSTLNIIGSKQIYYLFYSDFNRPDLLHKSPYLYTCNSPGNFLSWPLSYLSQAYVVGCTYEWRNMGSSVDVRALPTLVSEGEFPSLGESTIGINERGNAWVCASIDLRLEFWLGLLLKYSSLADECTHSERVASLEGMARPIAWDVIANGAIAGSAAIGCDTSSLYRRGGEYHDGCSKSYSDDGMHCKVSGVITWNYWAGVRSLIYV